MTKLLTAEQVRGCRERLEKLRKDSRWPLTRWFDDNDFACAIATIEALRAENARLKKSLSLLRETLESFAHIEKTLRKRYGTLHFDLTMFTYYAREARAALAEGGGE